MPEQHAPSAVNPNIVWSHTRWKC